MKTLTKITYTTTEQHKAAGPSRVKRVYNDAMKMVKFLVERDPFDDNIHLMNIDTGEVADASVNVYNAKQIGDGILKNMAGKHIFDYSYKRKDMAVTITAKHSLKHDGENIQIDYQLLFQRLLTIAGREDLQLESALSFELSTFPAALFDKGHLMRTANKLALAEAIWKLIGKGALVLPSGLKFVLDGGSLLAKNRMEKGRNF